jgi:hypothetical protein
VIGVHVVPTQRDRLTHKSLMIIHGYFSTIWPHRRSQW